MKPDSVESHSKGIKYHLNLHHRLFVRYYCQDNRHGVAGLATALTYAVARERGEVTHRLMTQDLDISPLAAETILQALQPVVYQYFDIEDTGWSVADIEAPDAAEGGAR